MKTTVLISYIVLFFSLIFVVLILFFGFNIIFYNIIDTRLLSSKYVAQTLASIINSIFSSPNNISLIIVMPPREMKIYFFDSNVTVYIGKEKYEAKYYKPNYIYLNVTNPLETVEEIKNCLYVIKIDDKIDLFLSVC